MGSSDNSSIPVSNEMRKSLKVLATHRDYSYEELLEELKTVYEGSIPFKSEKEFTDWFEDNYEMFGFRGIISPDMGTFPDYSMENFEGEEVKVEAELMAKNFKDHSHDSEEVDKIVCAWSSVDEIEGVPVVALEKVESEGMKYREMRGKVSKTWQIDEDVAEKLGNAFQVENVVRGVAVNESEIISEILRRMIETVDEDAEDYIREKDYLKYRIDEDVMESVLDE